MAFFTKDQTLQTVLNNALKGVVGPPSGVYVAGVPTSGRLNSVSFDQHRVDNGSGCAVTDPNAIETYSAHGLYGLADYYPLNILATGVLQVKSSDYSQMGVVTVVSPAGNPILELPPNRYTNRPVNNSATTGITATGTYGLYIGLEGRSSTTYRVDASIVGSSATAGVDTFSNLNITGTRNAISGVAYPYTMAVDGPVPTDYLWESTVAPNTVIDSPTTASTNITWVDTGTDKLKATVSNPGPLVTNSPFDKTININVTNPTFGTVDVSGPLEVASGVANSYSISLPSSTVPSATVAYSWQTTAAGAVIGSPTSATTTITFPSSGTFDVYGTVTSASSQEGAASGTIVPTASGYIPPSLTIGTVSVTGPSTAVSGVDYTWQAGFGGNVPAGLVQYAWSTTGNAVVTSGTSQYATIRFNDSGNQSVIATLSSNFAEDSPQVDTHFVSVTQPSSYTSFAVTVQYYSGYYTSGNKYYIDGSRQATVALTEGQTYRFDQSDSSNAGHPLRFSTQSDGTHGGGTEYTTGVTYNGTPGQADAFTEITVAAGAPTIYYYCSNHSGMGGTATT